MAEMFASEKQVRRLEQALRLLASASLIALIAGGIAWEAVLAPLRPGGSWLTLKVLPLLLPLPGILNGRRYTYQWSSMLILLYFAEGVTRAWSDTAPSSWYAVTEILLATSFYVASVGYAWITRPSFRQKLQSAP
jgi:uncharacterized membrane protein